MMSFVLVRDRDGTRSLLSDAEGGSSLSFVVLIVEAVCSWSVDDQHRCCECWRERMIRRGGSSLEKGGAQACISAVRGNYYPDQYHLHFRQLATCTYAPTWPITKCATRIGQKNTRPLPNPSIQTLATWPVTQENRHALGSCAST